jgi:hypothetical protein
MRGDVTINVNTGEYTKLIPFSTSYPNYNLASSLNFTSFSLSVNDNNFICLETGFYLKTNSGSIIYIPLNNDIAFPGKEFDVLQGHSVSLIAQNLIGGVVEAGIYIGLNGLRYTANTGNPGFSNLAHGITNEYVASIPTVDFSYDLIFIDYGLQTNVIGNVFASVLMSGTWTNNSVTLTFDFADTQYGSGVAAIQLQSLFLPVTYITNQAITNNVISYNLMFTAPPVITISAINGATSTTATLAQIRPHNNTAIFPFGKNILFNGPKISNPADTLTITITSPDSAYTVYNPTDNQQTTRVYNAYLSMLVQNVG